MRSTHAERLDSRIQDRDAVVAVVGLGYVGLPIADAFHSAGFPVIGFDIDPEKIDALARGETYLRHLGEELALRFADSDRFRGTTDPAAFAEADVVLICVPTPLGEHREPDLSFLVSSAESVAQHMRPGTLVVLESTSYPGTTREVVAPILQTPGFELGDDLFVAYCPEREDPGREGWATRDVPRLMGGLDEVSGELATQLYAEAITTVHRVASAEIAEAAKILENVYRSVNIALVNEMKMILDRMDIDVWEVIDAAATKPFGFQPFRPGPGLGGHCIPIDPFYLTWKARQVGSPTRFIELAGEINTAMPRHVVSRLQTALNEHGKPVRGSSILVVGIAYKPDVDDSRETPAAEILALLEESGARIAYHDPHIPVFPRKRRYHFDLESETLTPSLLKAQDAVVIVTDHAAIDWPLIGAHARLIVDTRNAMAGHPVRGEVWKA